MGAPPRFPAMSMIRPSAGRTSARSATVTLCALIAFRAPITSSSVTSALYEPGGTPIRFRIMTGPDPCVAS